MSLNDTQACTEFEGVLKDQREKAWLIDFKDAGEQWIPKSQGEWSGKDTWLLTNWIAEQKGLL